MPQQSARKKGLETSEQMAIVYLVVEVLVGIGAIVAFFLVSK